MREKLSFSSYLRVRVLLRQHIYERVTKYSICESYLSVSQGHATGTKVRKFQSCFVMHVTRHEEVLVPSRGQSAHTVPRAAPTG